MKPKTRLPFLAAFVFAHSAQAASDSWNVNANGLWSDAANWAGLQVPGATSDTANGDVATFSFALTAPRLVTVDANHGIGGISFGNTTVFGYKLSGGSLLLNSGGTIQTLAGNGAHMDTISSAIQIQGDGGSATFAGNASGVNSFLNIGSVTGVSSVSNLTTLNLDGTNTGGNVITGIIGDGTGGGKLAIAKAGAGTWQLNGANTYTGATTLTLGTLVANHASALGIGGDITFGGGTLRYTSKSAGQDWGARIKSSSAAILLDTGGNDVTLAGDIDSSNAFGLTKSGGGILTLSGSNSYTGTTTIGGTNAISSFLRLNHANALGGGGPITFAGGRLQFTANNTTDYSSLIASSTSAMNIDTNGQDVSFANALAGTNTGGLTKLGTGSLTLKGAVSNLYTGATTLAGGTLILDNTDAAGGNNGNRIVDSSGLVLDNGRFLYQGSDSADSSETLGGISGGGGNSTLTVSYGGASMATLTAASLSHSAAGNGTILVNGLNLGSNNTDTGSIGRILLTTAPTGNALYGTSDALASGINVGVTDTKIVPFLVGEATATSGGVGTATGIANTFVTYVAGSGLRPLNPTDEFLNNAVTAANNIYLTANTVSGPTASINSLVINGGNLLVDNASILTVASGAVLFASSNQITGGTLSFTPGSREALVTVNAGVTATIGSKISATGDANAAAGVAALVKSGAGNLILSNPANALTGGRIVVDGGGTVTISGVTTNRTTVTQTSKTLIGAYSANNIVNVTGRLVANAVQLGGGSFGGDNTYGLGGGNQLNILGPGNDTTYTMEGSGNNINWAVGGRSSNNSLMIGAGAALTTNRGSGGNTFKVGESVGANGNSVTVTGPNARWNSNNNNTFGDGGNNNSLVISNGGQARGEKYFAGIGANSSGNSILVEGLNSLLQTSNGNNGQFSIATGAGASNNSLTVQDGAVADLRWTRSTFTGHLGGNHNANDNFIRVTDPGTYMTYGTSTVILTIGGIESVANTLIDTSASGNHLDVFSGAAAQFNGPVHLMGVNSAFNLGDGTGANTPEGISTAQVASAGAFIPGVYLANEDSRLNFNSGRLVAGAAGSLISGLGSVVLDGAAHISTTQTDSAISSVISGAGDLIKEGSGTLILSAANTYTGSTIINSGILTLDYAVDAGKLADASTLTLAGGTLNLSGGTHNEVVASTSLLGGRSGVTSSGAILRMNTITPGVGIINFGASGVADTDNTNTNGILGAWATLGGSDWATSAASGSDISITAYTGYTDIDAGSGLISDGASTNVRLLADGSPGNITLGAPTTTINTLLQGNASVPATVDTDGATLATDGIMIGVGRASLTIGVSAGDGGLQTATAGANLVLNNNEGASSLTINAPILANGSSGLATAGAVTLNGVNTYTGDTGVGGALTIGGAGQLNSGSYSGAISLSTGASLTMNSSASQILGGVISGDGGLNQSGVGTTTLGGANTYTGATTVNDGILQAGHATAFGAASTASLTLNNSAKVRLNGNDITVRNLGSASSTAVIESGSAAVGVDTLTLDAMRSALGAVPNMTYAGILQDGSSRQLALVKNGIGALTLSGNSTYTGGTTLNGGTLTLASQTGLGTGTLTLGEGTIFQQSTFEGNAVGGALPFEINLAGGHSFFNIPFSFKDMWLSNDVTGPGTMKVVSDISGRTLTLSGAKSFTGGIIQSSQSLPGTGTGDNQNPNIAIDNVDSLGSGTFYAQINSISTSAGFLKPIADLSGGTGVENDVEIAAASRLLVDASSSNHLLLSGDISGGGSLRKIGDATLTLSGTNTYMGTTHVDAGTLVVNGSSSGTGAVSVGFSGTLGGTGTIGGTTTIQGFHTPGTSAGIQTFSNGLIYGGTSVLTWELNDDITTGRGANFDGIDVTAGDFTIAVGGTIDLSFGASVDFLDSFWGSNRSWTVVDLGSDVSTDGGFDLFALGAINGGANYNPLLGTFDVVRVADVNLKNDVVLQWTSSAAPSTYATWAAAFSSPVLSDQAADADPDFDGLENALEYVIGSDPRTPNQGGPSGGVVGTNLVLNLTRVDSSETADVGLKVEVSTDLQDWTTIGSYTIGEDTGSSTSGVVVDEGTPTTDPDAITITIPKGADVKKFARVTVTITP